MTEGDKDDDEDDVLEASRTRRNCESIFVPLIIPSGGPAVAYK
jgi:hypothetical protein